MYFKKIEMHGFKSFAEQVSIEFDKGVTCIVGPNGSGKSNISDAIRWVLGEQSPKTLRGGKMEDVIFAGTESRKARGMAEVVLVIDNSKGILPIDYVEVAITRRVFRSGESEYFINNNQCRLKDIRELIMDTGIGVDGYSLIGQGKIADMVSNKTESRREIFEEAAGIVKYRSKKQETERKLESTKGNLDRVNDIISEIESRIDGLKEDSEKAEKYLKLKDRYKELEINITLKNIDDIDLKIEYLKDDIAEISYQIDELKSEKVELEETIENGKISLEDLEKRLNNSSEELVTLTEELGRLANLGDRRKEQIAYKKQDKERLEKEIEDIENKLIVEEKNLKSLEESKIDIQQKGEELENTLKQQEFKYLKNYEKEKDLSIEIDSLREEIYSNQRDITVKNSEKETLKSVTKNLSKREEELLKEIEEGKNQNLEISEKNKKEVQRFLELKNKLEELKEQRFVLGNQYSETEKFSNENRHKLEETVSNLGQIKFKKNTLEDMQNRYDGYNVAVKNIMEKNFQGVEGVVAELLKVPAGFETAIETALGGSMQNIVCKRDKDAEEIISFLKRNKAGRITLLPMDSIIGTKATLDININNEKGFKGLGTDCVKFESKYQDIMNYLLGRVIVVDVLENAIALSKKISKGYRFVTLEGEIVNPKGAITGGAYRKNQGNLLERRNAIEKFARDIEITENLIVELKHKQSIIETEATELKNKISVLEKDYRTVEIETISLDNILKSSKDVIARWENSKNKQEEQVLNIQEEQKSAGLLISKLEEEIEGKTVLDLKLQDSLKEKIVELEVIKNSLEAENKELDKIKMENHSMQSEINTMNQLQGRMLGDIETLQESLEYKNKALNEAIETLEALENQKDTESNLQEKMEQKEQVEKYIAELKAEKIKFNNEFTNNFKYKESLDEKIEKLSSNKYEFEIKKTKIETQMEGYKNKIWDEFEISYLQAMEFRKKDFDMKSSQKECRTLKSDIKSLGEINIGAIKEYAEVKERYEFLSEQKSDIIKGMEDLKQIILDMDETIKRKFKESFNMIVDNFETIFQELFGGGRAMLKLEDESNPLECGIEIIAQPPGKKLQNINLMSGGEKTMTAIALMFAVLKSKPTPFCVLDEVEAALDDNNIERFSNYLKKFKDIQFALVTHQRATMEHSDVLYGVTMAERGISKVLSLKLGDKIKLD